MVNLRLFTILFVLLAFSLPLHAGEIEQEKQADSHVAGAEKTDADTAAEPQLMESPPTKADTASVEPGITSEINNRNPLPESAVTAYKSNPVAVKAVEKNMTLFKDRIKERFSIYLGRSGKYLELMKEIIKSKDLPEDIVFLSLIESGFNPYAYSVARAAGPWQFISSTARKYGLVIDWWRDERRDPVKSTEAAANYLKDLYGMFGSWNLAMAAYNAGEGKIMRALHRSKADDYWSLLKTRHIRRETKDYVPRFIAARLIAAQPEEFGFEGIEYHPPFDYDEVIVTEPVDLEVAAKCAETTIEIIRELNPELRRWCTPPDMPAYTLRIPAGTKEVFEKNFAEIPESERFSVETYTVKKGDSINSIAKKKKIPVKAILVLNSMDKVKPLKSGTNISLPPKEKFALDRDDRYELRKGSFRKSRKSKPAKSKSKKVLVTALNNANKKTAN